MSEEQRNNIGNRVDKLDRDAQMALYVVITHLLDVLDSDNGCAVTLMDAGSGKLTVMALGATELIGPILHAAADIAKELNTTPGQLQ